MTILSVVNLKSVTSLNPIADKELMASLQSGSSTTSPSTECSSEFSDMAITLFMVFPEE
jgi:hypothetical protein